MSTKKNVNENENAKVVVKGKVVAVTSPKNGDDDAETFASADRITITLDCEPFESIKFDTGEVQEKNGFGMNIYALVSQVKANVPYIELAAAMALGRKLNPQILSLALIGADLVVEREFKPKGSERENGAIAERDYWKSTIKSVVPHTKARFEAQLDKMIEEDKYLAESMKPKKTILNPLNI